MSGVIDVNEVLAVVVAVEAAHSQQDVLEGCTAALAGRGVEAAIVRAAGPGEAAAVEVAPGAVLVVRGEAAAAPDAPERLQGLGEVVRGRLATLELLGRIERAKQEWESTFDALGDGVAVIDAAGRVQRINRALAGFLGRDVRSVTGLRCCQLLPHHGDAGCPVTDERSEPAEAELERRTLRETVHRRDRDGSVILVVEDVTDARIAEARLRAADAALVQAHRIAGLTSLAAGLAHEINNPLGFVTSNLQVLRRCHAEALAAVRAGSMDAAAADRLGDDMAGAVDDALTGVVRIQRIVAAIAEFSDGAGSRPEAVDVARVLSDAARDAAERHAGSDPVRLVAPDVAAIAVARRRPLYLALVRLVDNALEAGGPVEGAVQATPEEVTVVLRDRGPGIDAELASVAADPFYTTRSATHHLGLGLTLARAVADGLGGGLALGQRGDGPGAEVRLSLPRETPAHTSGQDS